MRYSNIVEIAGIIDTIARYSEKSLILIVDRKSLILVNALMVGSRA